MLSNIGALPGFTGLTTGAGRAACPGPVSSSVALLGLTFRSLDSWTNAFSTTFPRAGTDPLSWISLHQPWLLTTLTRLTPLFWLLCSVLAPCEASAGCSHLPGCPRGPCVRTPLSHCPCISLPWWPCLVDLLVGISWLHIPDAQNKPYKLFNLMRPPTAVNLFSLPSASSELGQNKGMFSSRQFERLHAWRQTRGQMFLSCCSAPLSARCPETFPTLRPRAQVKLGAQEGSTVRAQLPAAGALGMATGRSADPPPALRWVMHYRKQVTHHCSSFRTFRSKHVIIFFEKVQRLKTSCSKAQDRIPENGPSPSFPLSTGQASVFWPPVLHRSLGSCYGVGPMAVPLQAQLESHPPDEWKRGEVWVAELGWEGKVTSQGQCFNPDLLISIWGFPWTPDSPPVSTTTRIQRWIRRHPCPPGVHSSATLGV